MDETPLETARRVWPGEWTESGGVLRRRLSSTDATPKLYVSVFDAGVGYGWWSKVCIDMFSWDIAEGNDFDHVLIVTRDRVQSMARDFARTAGVT